MLLPLLMNLDMFTEPAPVTDFRGRGAHAVSLVYAGKHAVSTVYVGEHLVTIQYPGDQEVDS